MCRICGPVTNHVGVRIARPSMPSHPLCRGGPMWPPAVQFSRPGRERCPQRSAAPSGAECRGRRSSSRHYDFRRSRAENRAASLKTPRCIRHWRRFGVFPRRPAAPSGAECRLNERSVVPLARLMPLAEICCLVMPPAAYFSWQRKVGKSCLSVYSKPVPRHESPLRLRLVPVIAR